MSKARGIIEVSAAREIPEGNDYECELCQEAYDDPRWVVDAWFNDDSAGHVCLDCLKKEDFTR